MRSRGTRRSKNKETPSNGFHVIPVQISRKWGRFDLGRVILRAIKSEGEKLENNDIIVVSSKFAAMSEGRVVKLSEVSPSNRANELSSRYFLDAPLAELVVRESEAVLGGIPGFALAVSKGILAPNAGIDRSNVPHGYAILYPENPKKTVEQLRLYLERHSRTKTDGHPRLGLVLSDSRITPTRTGTIGIAIAASGFKPVVDFRGKEDLFGNELKVTLKAVADQLSSAAQLVMGEAKEATPVVIIRGYNADMNEEGSPSMTIDHEKCLYIQGLKDRFDS
jgi:coenzyme F420-0:L-glutamate ligase / coenzyme F420-1:gamma-L-glutamate ligase